MPRPLRPFWLTVPSRFAGLPKSRAVPVALVLVALVLAAFTALATPDPAETNATVEVTDLALYESIIAGVRGGGDYYDVAAVAARAGDYPLRPFVTMRLPVHAVVQAALPAGAVRFMLYLLAAGVAAAWWIRLRPALARPPARLSAMILLAGGLVAFVQADLAAFHEIWAAMLVALALALRRPGRWIESAAVAVAAVLVRETAVLLPLVMLVAALHDGDRREAGGWALVLALFASALAAHSWGVAQVTGPLDPASPGWNGLLGPGFFVRALAASSALQALPMLLAAPLAALALFGWTAWRDPLAMRVALLLGGYALAIALFARADTFYWALMPAPLFLVGLAFAPDGLRDLAAALLDRRRVRVHRVTR